MKNKLNEANPTPEEENMTTCFIGQEEQKEHNRKICMALHKSLQSWFEGEPQTAQSVRERADLCLELYKGTNEFNRLLLLEREMELGIQEDIEQRLHKAFNPTTEEK